MVAMLGALFSLVALQGPLFDSSFELVGNRIYFPATVNGHAASAILDTGAGATVMDLGLADNWKLEGAGKIEASGAGPNTITGRFLQNSNIAFGSITHPVTIAIPLTSLAVAEGRRLEVILGKDFLDKYVVSIDYPHRRLSVYPGDMMVKMNGEVVPITFVSNHPHAKMNLTVDGKERMVDVMIDSGASSGTLSKKYLTANPVSPKLVTTPRTVVGGGVGGFDEGYFTRADRLQIGSISFTHFPIVLSDAKGGQLGPQSNCDFLLGGDILTRMRVLVDYPHKRLVFEATPEVAKPFEADKSGMSLFAFENDLRRYKVVRMLPGGAAETAGLQIGDEIVNVNGKAASTWSLQELRKEFRSPSVKSWNLQILRDGKPMSVEVVAKSVI